MHWTLAFMFAAVLWSLCAYWRKGSLALAASWIIAQAVWYATGDNVPIWLYVPLDAIVIASMIRWHSGFLDHLIVAIFPLQWMAYTWADPVEQWWTLWLLALCQFILAGPWRYTRQFNDPSPDRVRRHHAGA